MMNFLILKQKGSRITINPQKEYPDQVGMNYNTRYFHIHNILLQQYSNNTIHVCVYSINVLKMCPLFKSLIMNCKIINVTKSERRDVGDLYLSLNIL